MNWLYFFGALVVGFLCIIYSKPITDNTGRMDFAEKIIGGGGTYTMWKLIGVVLIIFGFYMLVNA